MEDCWALAFQVSVFSTSASELCRSDLLCNVDGLSGLPDDFSTNWAQFPAPLLCRGLLGHTFKTRSTVWTRTASWFFVQAGGPSSFCRESRPFSRRETPSFWGPDMPKSCAPNQVASFAGHLSGSPYPSKIHVPAYVPLLLVVIFRVVKPTKPGAIFDQWESRRNRPNLFHPRCLPFDFVG